MEQKEEQDNWNNELDEKTNQDKAEEEEHQEDDEDETYKEEDRYNGVQDTRPSSKKHE